jgi:aryl-alcohol dehydrogenase-like predicted oxidoreductase
MEQLDEYLSTLNTKVEDELLKEVDAIFEPGTHVSNYYSADFGPNARWV